MPGPNHVVLASGAAVAVSVALATAIAIYENPELRRYAEDVRRKIALAIQSLGDDLNRAHRDPVFNRPEDAHGFMQSSRGEGAEPGVDADEESRRRQREELLYWNSIRLAKEGEKAGLEGSGENEKPRPARQRGSSFDDFLRRDENADEEGTYVFKSGVDTTGNAEGLRRRGEGAAAFSSLYANPFADEHGIMSDEFEEKVERTQPIPEKDDMSDIYSVTTAPEQLAEARTPTTEAVPSLIDFDDTPAPATESSATLDRELDDSEYMTASQEDRTEAYQSIQAWAQNSHSSVFSSMPQSPTQIQPPAAAPSDVESLSDGQLTPTDSMSVIDAQEVANETQSRSGESGRAWDVISESDGMKTPASWSEVGSQISESDHAGRDQQRVAAW